MVVLLVFGGVLSYTTYQVNALAEMSALENVEAVVGGEYSRFTEQYIDSALLISKVLADTAEALLNNRNTTFTREEANQILSTVLKSNPQLLGTYYIFEPNKIDGRDAAHRNTEGHDETGRYIPYFTQDDQGNISLSPCAAYQTDEYYQTPKSTNQPYISNPIEYEANGKMVLMIDLIVPIRDPPGILSESPAAISP